MMQKLYLWILPDRAVNFSRYPFNMGIHGTSNPFEDADYDEYRLAYVGVAQVEREQVTDMLYNYHYPERNTFMDVDTGILMDTFNAALWNDCWACTEKRDSK